MALVRNVVRDVVRNVVRDIQGTTDGGVFPGDILGMSLARNVKLEGVAKPETFSNTQMIGLIFNFKL